MTLGLLTSVFLFVAGLVLPSPAAAVVWVKGPFSPILRPQDSTQRTYSLNNTEITLESFRSNRNLDQLAQNFSKPPPDSTTKTFGFRLGKAFVGCTASLGQTKSSPLETGQCLFGRNRSNQTLVHRVRLEDLPDLRKNSSVTVGDAQIDILPEDRSLNLQGLDQPGFRLFSLRQKTKSQKPALQHLKSQWTQRGWKKIEGLPEELFWAFREGRTLIAREHQRHLLMLTL